MNKGYRIRAAGFVIAAVMALSGIAAATAGAAQYQSEVEKTELHGQSKANLIITLGATFACPSFTASGEMVGKPSGSGTYQASTLVLAPTISGCSWAGQAITVEPNGCTLRLGEPSGSGSYSMKELTVECAAGKAIVFNAKSAGCSWSIGAQTIGNPASLSNEGTGFERSITARLEMGGVKFSSTGGICGGGGSNGVLSGKLNLTGTQHLVQHVGIFVG